MKKKLLLISCSSSSISVVITVAINLVIANRYLTADNKTRALFGIVETGFLYKYYFVILALTGLISSLFIFNTGRAAKIATLFSLLSILLIFTGVWRWFV
ncbi:MAG TPA: hypothetical protein VHB48_09455 [Chitinophagaceae bacterium]|nr:hypothetical protein [Chitinophagaceae bacterium]